MAKGRTNMKLVQKYLNLIQPKQRPLTAEDCSSWRQGTIQYKDEAIKHRICMRIIEATTTKMSMFHSYYEMTLQFAENIQIEYSPFTIETNRYTLTGCFDNIYWEPGGIITANAVIREMTIN